ncbi:MAG: hypothetical protein ACREUG_07485, partial [Steroidobacteraceae bacterium]
KQVVNVFGVVHPEAGGWHLDDPWTATAADGSKVQISLVDSVYLMRITTEGPNNLDAAVEDGSFLTWLNEVIYGHQPLLHSLLDALGLHLGARLYPEMKGGTVEGVGVIGSMTAMAAYGTVSGAPRVGGDSLVPTALMAISNPFARSALADVRNALAFDEDCPFFCYRTLESLRKHYAATTDATSESKSWEALRADLGIDRADIDALKTFADARRHGGAGTSLHADHLRWTLWTREVLGRFLKKHSAEIQQGAAPSVPDAEDCSPAW